MLKHPGGGGVVLYPVQLGGPLEPSRGKPPLWAPLLMPTGRCVAWGEALDVAQQLHPNPNPFPGLTRPHPELEGS